MRNATGSSSGLQTTSLRNSCWIVTANRSASGALSNSASTPSPATFITRPP
jgi:hypothetical protein